LNAVRSVILGFEIDYSQVIPPTGLTQDVDGVAGIGPLDLNTIRNMLLGMNLSVISGRAASLIVLESPAGPVAAGDTCRVTIGVRNEQGDGWAQGFAVVFEVASGNATLMGGDGSTSAAAPGNRYDFSGASGSVSIIVRPNASGTITIDAFIPACGALGTGRSCAEIDLATPIQIASP
jgi:hypothetical protein